MLSNKTTSTSIHNLNADSGLSKIQKITYLFLNFVNNLLPYWWVDSRIKFKKFGDLPWKKYLDKTYAASSAARKTSDLFWRALPWENVERAIGAKIHVFDTGCGQGNYGPRIMEASGGRVVAYTGVDAKRRENWSLLEGRGLNLSFIESNSTKIISLIPPETNLFVTQSAIEHFDHDINYFEQVREFVDKSSHKVAQIHIFPAGATLPLYLFHGLRQYVPRTISKITKLFSDDYNFELYGLGGRECAKIHFRYFTWPTLIIRKFEKPTFNELEYAPLIESAIEKDSKDMPKSPIFWALIITPK